MSYSFSTILICLCVFIVYASIYIENRRYEQRLTDSEKDELKKYMRDENAI